MKKNLLYIISLFVANIGLNSCSEDEIVNKVIPQDGEYIQFSIGQDVDSRTQYDSDDAWQIEWVNGDEVRIFSKEAKIGEVQKQHAAYTVIPGEEETITGAQINGTTLDDYKSNVKGTLTPNENGLQWSGEDIHNFYAVYPADGTKVVNSSYDYDNGIVTFKHIANQSITATETSTGSGIWTSSPKMENAYMVAKAENVSRNSFGENSKIELRFKPIMTTLELTIMGSDTENIPATITGVSVVNTFTEGNGIEVNGEFQYDIKQEKVVVKEKGVTTMTTYIEVENQVSLDKGDKLTLTVILPPIELTKTNTKIIIHASRDYDIQYGGGSGIATAVLADNITISASSKKRITLPEIKTPLTNNWISQLDGNIYVSQLSIPGTHDAATGNGSSWGDIGETQGLNLTQQLNMGVRAFDLRPAYVTENSTGVLRIYHGYAPTTEYWENALTTFKTFLKNNPKEFIIIVMREEEESSDESSFDATMQASLKTLAGITNESTGKSYMASWKPDITIEDIRGQILLLCRTWTPYTTTEYPLYGAYMDWGHSDNCVTGNIWGTSDTYKTTFYLQDCYSPGETEDWNAHSHSFSCYISFSGVFNCSTRKAVANSFDTYKWNAVEKLLNITKTFHTDANKKNHWAINHTSGYVAGKETGHFSTSTTAGYQENAENINLKLKAALTADTWEGSTGIILMDFVGIDVINGYKVNGASLPQIVIDNNYKYHLKRKGE